MSWIGGKKALRDEILLRFPIEFGRYIEVFGGGGWILFHKPVGNEFEVYNDFNPNLANLFRCVRDAPEDLKAALQYTLNSRLDFKHVRTLLKTQTELPDVKRAACFYQLIRQSYASNLDSFGGAPRSMWSKFPLIDACCGRLQKVVIENRDFEHLIKQYDRPDAFFYCDPPYFETEDYYEDVGFTQADHQRLADALMGIQGRFLLSYNDCPEIQSLYTKPGIFIESTTRLSNIAQRYEGGKQYAELIIGNYDTTEKVRQQVQLTLWDDPHEIYNILSERTVLFNG
ncbi:MAG: DNA adenine methylase [Oscillospiraceae bacterium]|jgi:DNA adenine methylase|nr:DNA adenine methylase [Oscillospiraceae bacterium]